MGSATIEGTNGHGHSGGGSGDGSGDATHDAVVKSFSRRTNYKPSDPVQVRITAELRDRFDAWYRGQYPGVPQPPSRDPWIEEVFRLGLEQIEDLMPPVQSPTERLEAARKGRKS